MEIWWYTDYVITWQTHDRICNAMRVHLPWQDMAYLLMVFLHA